MREKANRNWFMPRKTSKSEFFEPPKSMWVIFDLSNGDKDKGYYIWQFLSRKQAKEFLAFHRAQDKKLGKKSLLTELSEPFRYILPRSNKKSATLMKKNAAKKLASFLEAKRKKNYEMIMFGQASSRKIPNVIVDLTKPSRKRST